jgi:poly(3-hydroxybutyrate) depolymerase
MRTSAFLIAMIFAASAWRSPCFAVCPGCNGNASPPSGNLSITAAGLNRTFVLVLPSGYDGSTPWPVVFAFHGTTSNGAQFIGRYYGNVTNGVGNRAIIVAPDGLVRDSMTGWVNVDGSGIFDSVDYALFDSLVSHLKANYCVDEHRIFSMGHSAGAMISNQFGYIRGTVLRGIAPFNGGGPYTYRSSSGTGKVAAFIGHNPYELSAATDSCPWAVPWATTGWPSLKFWCKNNGCNDPGEMPTAPFSGTPPCSTYTGCDPNYSVVLCLYDYSDKWDCQHAFPTPWGAKAAVDFFLSLPSLSATQDRPVAQARSAPYAGLGIQMIDGGVLISFPAMPPAEGRSAAVAVFNAQGSLMANFSNVHGDRVFWATSGRNAAEGAYLVRAQLPNGSAMTRMFVYHRRY